MNPNHHRSTPDSPDAAASQGGTETPVWLLTGFGMFVVVIGYLLVTSLKPRRAAEYEPSPMEPADTRVTSLVYDTVTIDALDPTTWRFFDFDRRSLVGVPDTAGWDLAVRRFMVIAADAAVDLGKVAFDEVVEAPSSNYVTTAFGRDTVNAALERWYHYSLWSHLLEPNGHVYVVRTREGHYAKLEFLSYYCPGVVAGCLTFRYVYQPSGSAEFVGGGQ